MTDGSAIKPNFFIVGATKSGTTSLYEYLNQHPDIFLVDKVKEPGFWSWQDIRGPLTVTSERHYLQLFSNTQNYRYRGDASTYYLFSCMAAERIRRSIPDAKIIIALRNPVDLMHAHHQHLVWEGVETIEDFAHALERERERRSAPDATLGHYSLSHLFYREWANLAVQTRRFLDAFGKSKVHFVVFDDLANDPLGTTQAIFRFLDVDPTFKPDIRIHNQSRGMRNRWLHRLLHGIPPSLQWHIRMLTPSWILNPTLRFLRWTIIKHEPRTPLDPELRNKLLEEFKPMIEELSVLTGRDLSHWCRMNSQTTIGVSLDSKGREA